MKRAASYVEVFHEHMRKRERLRRFLLFLVPVRISHEFLRSADVRTSIFCESLGVRSGINFLEPELFFLILAHSVHKMRII